MNTVIWIFGLVAQILCNTPPAGARVDVLAMTLAKIHVQRHCPALEIDRHVYEDAIRRWGKGDRIAFRKRDEISSALRVLENAKPLCGCGVMWAYYGDDGRYLPELLYHRESR